MNLAVLGTNSKREGDMYRENQHLKPLSRGMWISQKHSKCEIYPIKTLITKCTCQCTRYFPQIVLWPA